jgi:hypothetical protein
MAHAAKNGGLVMHEYQAQRYVESLAEEARIREAGTVKHCGWCRWAVALGLALTLFSLASLSRAADFSCSAGDVVCLIQAITTANGNAEANRITLEAGNYTLTAVNNFFNGDNGLPIVTGNITIDGKGINSTILERSASAPPFRFAWIAAEGTLTLSALTVQGGFVSLSSGGGFANLGTLALEDTLFTNNNADPIGGVVNNGGNLTIARSLLVRNSARDAGGAIFNSGTATITRTTISENVAGERGGGLINVGTIVLTDSTIADNVSGGTPGSGGGIGNSGNVIAINTTFAGNRGSGSSNVGGAIANGGTVVLTNSTIADNRVGFQGGGIHSAQGKAILTNTILARNTADAGSPDCVGQVISLGSNVVGDPTGCGIILRDTDFTGDPGLRAFADNGDPGNGHFPLAKGSPAIGAGDNAFCPAADQLGQRRSGPCDIGAINFPGRDKHEPPKKKSENSDHSVSSR